MNYGSYTVIVSYQERVISSTEADDIEEAREVCARHVQVAMDAFSDDREALERYGFVDAEEKALAMPEDGGTIILSSGDKIEVINNEVVDS
jgi:deoxycytidylate deaminase